MKNFLAVAFCIFGISVNAQLKVDPSGRIGMGTLYPNTGYKCHIKGNLLLSTYPENPFIELRFKVGNGEPGAEIGTNVDKIAFWSSETGYNKLYAEQYLTISDSSLKVNIKPLNSSLENLLKLKTYSYQLKESPESDVPVSKTQFGFLSQEVEDLFPSVQITDNYKGVKLMDYNQIIPLAVRAIQEQQAKIELLEKEISVLRSQVQPVGNQQKDASVNMLFQNSPNPFNERTSIKYSVEKLNFQTASMLIFDMNGTLLSQYPISNPGYGEIELNARQLKAGMYIYSLIVNEKEIDSKRMILVN